MSPHYDFDLTPCPLVLPLFPPPPRQMLIRALEELKECKVDRATLDELIETKADRSSVEKKVSSWQFEQACQELTQGLATMLDKMGSQVGLLEGDLLGVMCVVWYGVSESQDRRWYEI